MIGVDAEVADRSVIAEFFELFKTPWEFVRARCHYDVLLRTADRPLDASGRLVLIYAGRKTSFDKEQDVRTIRDSSGCGIVSGCSFRIPIYGDVATFPAPPKPLLTEEASQACVAYLNDEEGRVSARIGYDLFAEIRSLLTVGQPVTHASLPALELHIDFLRNLIIACGIPLIEIPPVPEGHSFVVCLTHDVDHPSIRQHRWDRTVFGFLFRAIFASVSRVLRGQLSPRNLFRNWMAALKLPFVHLGWAKDFWRDFDDRYLELEGSNPSTFFVIPFAGRPGKALDGPAPGPRASRYGAQYLAETLKTLRVARREIGLHGIDAWIDSAQGRHELDEIRRLAPAEQIGVRMHWLYHSQGSAAKIEAAGASFDSSIGYNETIGYRAGTTQIYKPLEAERLLELPLHAMDTAMFYPSYLNFSNRQARACLRQLADNAAYFGGTLTINWHDRSLAPERLWGACYDHLIKDLSARRVWFATAGQAVSWFRKRRSAVFQCDPSQPGKVRALVTSTIDDALPDLRVRVHKAGNLDNLGVHSPAGYSDAAIKAEMTIALGASGIELPKEEILGS